MVEIKSMFKIYSLAKNVVFWLQRSLNFKKFCSVLNYECSHSFLKHIQLKNSIQIGFVSILPHFFLKIIGQCMRICKIKHKEKIV